MGRRGQVRRQIPLLGAQHKEVERVWVAIGAAGVCCAEVGQAACQNRWSSAVKTPLLTQKNHTTVLIPGTNITTARELALCLIDVANHGGPNAHKKSPDPSHQA